MTLLLLLHPAEDITIQKITNENTRIMSRQVPM